MVVWVNDPVKKLVVVGNHGFVWWFGRRIIYAKFRIAQDSPVVAFNKLCSNKPDDTNLKGSIRGYDQSDVTHSSMLHFVRTGVFPM